MDSQERKRRIAARQAAARRNRVNQGLYLGVLLAGLLVVLTLATFFGTDREYSESENRMLAQRPAFSAAALADGSWFAGLEDWFADQFTGRDGWISANLSLRRALGQQENGGVYLGKDGYLIQQPETPNQPALDRNLAAINAFAAAHPDLSCRMTLVPNAVSILADKLPANAPAPDQQAQLETIRSSLTGVDFLDVTQALQAHADEALYYRTDHHWTSLGASYAFAAMVQGLEIAQPVTEYDIYTVSNTFQGTLASKSGCHDSYDTVQLYVPRAHVDYKVTYASSQTVTATIYDRTALESKDHYTVFFGGNHPRVDIDTTAETGKKLLLFKDSYANCFVQFLTPYYETIVMVDPRYYYDNIDTLIKQAGITEVLYLYNLDTFQTDTSLADVLETTEK